jgi:hypothetical protein
MEKADLPMVREDGLEISLSNSQSDRWKLLGAPDVDRECRLPLSLKGEREVLGEPGSFIHDNQTLGKSVFLAMSTRATGVPMTISTSNTA